MLPHHSPILLFLRFVDSFLRVRSLSHTAVRSCVPSCFHSSHSSHPSFLIRAYLKVRRLSVTPCLPSHHIASYHRIASPAALSDFAHWPYSTASRTTTHFVHTSSCSRQPKSAPLECARACALRPLKYSREAGGSVGGRFFCAGTANLRLSFARFLRSKLERWR